MPSNNARSASQPTHRPFSDAVRADGGGREAKANEEVYSAGKIARRARARVERIQRTLDRLVH